VKGPIAWFARNHVAANLLMFLVLIGGITALPSIQQKTFPDIDIEMIQIAVPYLGAAPEEVEQGVCIRIEEEVHGISGVERLTSSAAEGACGVTAELIEGYPTDRALAEIKNAVDGITTFPAETEQPVISHFELKRNALKLALSGDTNERSLRVWGERIRDEIAALPGVTQVELTGARDYEISIEVSEESLRRYGLTFDEVARAVRRSSLDLPGGSIRTDAGEILLRAKGQAYAGHEFEDIVVVTREDGTRLLLGEVANVVDGFEQDERRANFDGARTVMIQVSRVGDQKVLELVETVEAYVDEARLRLPEGLSLTVWQNDAVYLKDRLGILVRNGVTGFILVFAVLALFLRLRLAFWVAIGVPISIMGALWMFPIAGLSIDVLTLFAFILVLGLLVDDAIVVGENIHSHQEAAEEPLSAAISGATEVVVPVIFGVLTTVAAFLPMILSPGMMGSFFGTIGVVVSICLFFSVVESQLVLPAHLGHHADAERKQGRPGTLNARWKALQGVLSGSLVRLAREGYRPALELALAWRYTALAIAVAALLVAISVMATHVPFSFFPEIESDYVSADVKMPLGTPIDRTDRAVALLRESAERLKAELDGQYSADGGGSVVKHILASVGEPSGAGRGGPPSSSGAGAGTHIGGVAIELVGGDDRGGLSAKVVEDAWRAQTPPIPGTEELTFSSSYMNAGAPIYIEFRSPDVARLQLAADSLKEKLTSYPGLYDIADSWQDGKQEVKLDILPTAEPLGLTLEDLASQVRQAFYGAEAQRIQRGRDDIRVMVRYPESERRSMGDLEEMRVRTPSGSEVPFYAVAQADRGQGFSTIRRADRQRVISVTSNLDPERANANQIVRELEQSFLPGLLSSYPGLAYALEGEQREQRKTMQGLMENYAFAMILIYILLAIPLRSYFQPLIIMAVIPFGLIGAIFGHVVLGIGFSMMSVFGVVALSGVVVNSSLVLVHYINTRRDRGLPLHQAVREAGVSRFRPIVLTSVTTFAGLGPLLLEQSMGAQFLIPMAASLGFGVIFATAISLFLVPCSYVILDDLVSGARRLLGRQAGPGVSGPAASGASSASSAA
jgi:multidrug efflux pump subunit AcrB